jgi:hypothetical protein
MITGFGLLNPPCGLLNSWKLALGTFDDALDLKDLFYTSFMLLIMANLSIGIALRSYKTAENSS